MAPVSLDVVARQSLDEAIDSGRLDALRKSPIRCHPPWGFNVK